MIRQQQQALPFMQKQLIICVMAIMGHSFSVSAEETQSDSLLRLSDFTQFGRVTSMSFADVSERLGLERGDIRKSHVRRA